VYIDGGSRGNPGEGAVSFIIYDENNIELFRFGKKIGFCTNNFAEYNALIEALKYLVNNKSGINSNDKVISFYSDSLLLVNQMNGIYKVRNKNIEVLVNKAKNLIDKVNNVIIKYIPREKNVYADEIVNNALDEQVYRPADRSQDVSIPEESPGS